MLNNRDGTDRRPQLKGATSSQGAINKGYSKDNANGELKQSHSRYDKGMSLYREGKVKLNSNGLFKVSGYYEADTEKMTCTCPDYKTRKESCKHLFAAMLFVKNGGKQTIEHLEGQGNFTVYCKNGKDIPDEIVPHEWKEFDRQATITRLAVLNTAVAALQTYHKPITAAEIIEYAAQLEKWALGQEAQS